MDQFYNGHIRVWQFFFPQDDDLQIFKKKVIVTAIAVGYRHMGVFPKLHCLKTDLTILCGV